MTNLKKNAVFIVLIIFLFVSVVLYFIDIGGYVLSKYIKYNSFQHPGLYTDSFINRAIKPNSCLPNENYSYKEVNIGQFNIIAPYKNSLEIKAEHDSTMFIEVDSAKYILIKADYFDIKLAIETDKEFQSAAKFVRNSEKLNKMRDIIDAGLFTNNRKFIEGTILTTPRSLSLSNHISENKLIVGLLDSKSKFMSGGKKDIYKFDTNNGSIGFIAGDYSDIKNVNVILITDTDNWLDFTFRDLPGDYIDCFLTKIKLRDI